MLFHYLHIGHPKPPLKKPNPNIDRAAKHALFKGFYNDIIGAASSPQISNSSNEVIINNHFTFIQIPKTSSTNVLKQCRKLNMTRRHWCYRHEGLPYLEHFINKTLPVYAIVRNPFDHALSYYFHQVARKEFYKDTDLIKGFRNFVSSNLNNIHLNQCAYIKSNKGIKVKLFRYENKDLNRYIMRQHGINLQLNKFKYNQGSKSNTASKLKSNCGISIQQFYNKRIASMIVKARHNEFDTFKYSTSVLDTIQSPK